MRLIFLLSFIFIPIISFAELPPPVVTEGEDEEGDAPEMPMPIESGETMEPDITIIRRGKKTIHEYRANGKVYKVKIVPDIGPAYYLVDPDGDGNMEVRNSDLEKGIKVHQWELYSW